MLITPAKFLSNAGDTPKSWNEKMLHDSHLRIVHYEQNSANIFPNTDIKGGVVVTLRDATQNFGEIGIFTPLPELQSILKKVTSMAKQSFNEIAFSSTSYKFSDRLLQDHPDIETRRPKGHKYDIAPNIFEVLPEIFFDKQPSDNDEYVRLLGRLKGDRVYKWIKRAYIKNHPNLDKYKVIVPHSNGSGALGEVVSTPLVGTPLVGTTQTFMTFGQFDNRSEAEAALKYVKTKFARVMLGVLKVTQHNPISVWAKVPLQNFTSESDIDWMTSVGKIDNQLFSKYGLDQQEIAFIEEKVQGME